MPPLSATRRARSWFRLAFAAAALASATSVPAQPVATRSAAAALAEDAGVYAARYGVDLAEALRRLRVQDQSAAATAALAAAYADRLAGLYVEHVPDFRLVMLLTGDAPEPDRTVAVGGDVLPVAFRTGAVATRAQLLDAIARHQAAIRAALIDPPGLGVDERGGRLLLVAGADDADPAGLPALEAAVAAIAQVPVRAVVPGREGDLAAAAGGTMVEGIDRAARRRYRCTTGFVVTDGARTAVTTAAHCPDDIGFPDVAGVRVPLAMVGAWGAGTQDVQIHVAAAPFAPFAPLFHAGGDPAALRAVATWRPRAATRTGDFVCHQGEASGYSCAEVLVAAFAPPGDLCAGPCPATWTSVAGPGCRHGDSGGPVFLGATAVGTVKSGSYRADGRCGYYVYMSTDMLPSGWTLLH